MRITIHEQAAKSIDERAEAIRQEVRRGVRKPKQPSSEWRPDVYGAEVSPDDLIGPLRMSRGGSAPLIVAEEGGRARFLRGSRVNEFEVVCTTLWKAIRPRGAVSRESVQEIANEWLLDPDASLALSIHCLDELSQRVREYTVWIPIAELHVQSSFFVGTVEFRTVTADVITSWIKTDYYSSLQPDEQKKVDEYHQQLDKELRGYAAGIVSVEAEPVAARESALERIENALSILRLFADPALMPHLRSHCAPRGQENIERYRIILECDGGFRGESRGFLNYDGRPWIIRDDELSEFKQLGLKRLGQLLESPKLTDFQSRAMVSLRLYADSTRESRITTRLVLMLAALEGLFLKGPNETIQQNLGERLAMIAKDTPDERIAVTRLVRRVYGERSKFVHRSENVELSKDIEEFTKLAWFALMDVVANLDAIETTQEFIDNLDRLKMSGQSVTRRE